MELHEEISDLLADEGEDRFSCPKEARKKARAAKRETKAKQEQKYAAQAEKAAKKEATRAKKAAKAAAKKDNVVAIAVDVADSPNIKTTL